MPEFGLVHYNFKGSFEEFLDFSQANEFRCTELLAGDVWNFKNGETFESGKERAAQVRSMLESRGMRASAIAPQNDFLVTNEEEMTKQVNRMRQWCEIAHIAGTSILRIDGGWAKPEVPDDRDHHFQLIVDGLNRCKEFVESEGITLALDNHGVVTNDADFQVKILESVGSKSIGANVDTMNYRWFGHDLDTLRRFYKTIAPYVKHCHFKDGHGSRAEYVGTALGEGEIPLIYAVESFQAAGYQGPWLVEYEGKTDHEEGFRKGLRWLQANVK